MPLIANARAYGYTMSSQYNSRAPALEVLIPLRRLRRAEFLDVTLDVSEP